MTNPAWMAVVGGVAAAVIVQAIAMSWDERRSVAGSSGSLVEVALYSSASLGSLALGIWTGVATTRRTSRAWAGWLVGAAATFLATFAQMALYEMALGVEAMRTSMGEQGRQLGRRGQERAGLAAWEDHQAGGRGATLRATAALGRRDHRGRQ
jgi:hypothetical protein